MKPIIGIVAKPLLNSQLKANIWTRLVINDEFRKLVVDLGGIPIGIIPNKFYYNKDTNNNIERLPKEDKEDLISLISKCDGIILQGGLTSDTYEIEIVKFAIKNNIPIIGICAGFNNIVRTLGLPLKQSSDIAKIHNVYDKNYRHKVYITNSNLFENVFDNEIVEVNSFHSMILNLKDAEANKNIEVIAVSLDKENSRGCKEDIKEKDKISVECFMVKNTRFCLAIKWHPELMLENKETWNIFKCFIEKCNM